MNHNHHLPFDDFRIPRSEFYIPMPYDPTATFGDYLRFLRRRARLTQSQLSIAVGYSPGQISMLENGQRTPDLSAVAARFVPALGLEDDAQAVAQLLRLAQATASPTQAAGGPP